MGWLADMTILSVSRLGFLNSLSVGPDEPPPPSWLPIAHSFTQFLAFALLLVAVAGWIFVTAPPRQVRSLQQAS
jgi:hypothetical protein